MDAKVLILGGGVAGVIAARTLKENGIKNFVIIEARNELGGRLQNFAKSGKDKNYHLEASKPRVNVQRSVYLRYISLFTSPSVW
jgi:monoamine oxidase